MAEGRPPRDRRAAAKAALLERIGYQFRDPELFERALTHASVGEGQARALSNERLEFLGDRVLGLLTAERLLAADPAADEGALTPRLHALVDAASCARAAASVGLGDAMRLAGGISAAGGRKHERVLADGVEALLAAVWLDGGPEAARAVYERLWAGELAAGLTADAKDAKTRLQEWAQAQGRPLPAYAVVARTGPDHAPRFTVEAAVEGVAPQRAEGRSRQQAEKAAAAALLQRETG